MKELLPQLSDNNQRLKPLTYDGLTPYENAISRFTRRIPRIYRLLRGPFMGMDPIVFPGETADDMGYNFRGSTLGDLIIAAVATEGRIIANPPAHFDTGDAVTQVITFTRGPARYAVTKSKERKTAKRILYGLQLDKLGYSIKDIKKSILMSPIVIRFKYPGDNREYLYGAPSLPYRAIIPPYEIQETTQAWRNWLKTTWAIDIEHIQAVAKKFEQLNDLG